jgi:hypothetical protein
MGITAKAISVMMVYAVIKYVMSFRMLESQQCPGNDGFHSFSIGVHWT